MEFRDRYSPVKGFYEKGYPEHSTVCISLWGLQYRFPEHDFSNDLIIATDQFIKTDKLVKSPKNAIFLILDLMISMCYSNENFKIRLFTNESKLMKR